MSMFIKIGLGYLLLQIAVVVIFLTWSGLKDKRLKENHGKIVPEGYETTGEIYIDPISQKKHEIYFNKTNGKRFHKEYDEHN